ncbi:MAG: hypothetical protein AAGF47_07420 [Planctomycetota bacterium]
MTTNDNRAMTWAGLLGKWSEFARGAVALPDDGEGGRVKRAVPEIIALQSITHALGELHELSADEQALGLDRAEIGIREHAAAVHAIWGDEPLHPMVAELIDDALAALALASSAGLEWTVDGDPLVTGHPAELLEALAEVGFRGDLFLPTPGVPIFAGAPAAFCRFPKGEDDDPTVVGLVWTHVEGTTPAPGIARQVYRQFDFAKGGPVRDLVVPLESDLPAGQPLLVPAVLAGEAQTITLPIPGADRQSPLPVEFG